MLAYKISFYESEQNQNVTKDFIKFREVHPCVPACSENWWTVVIVPAAAGAA